MSKPPVPDGLTGPARKRRGRPLLAVLAFLILLPPFTVLSHWLAPSPLTFLMTARLIEGEGFHRDWRPLARISPNLVLAVIAAEDANYCRHHGFDIAAIERALKHNKKKPNYTIIIKIPFPRNNGA